MDAVIRVSIHDCSGPDRQDGVHERNWSITDETARGVIQWRPGLPKRCYPRPNANLGGRSPWIRTADPHKRGARRAMLTHPSTPELAQNKRTVAKIACKIFIFRHALLNPQIFRLPHHFYRSHAVLTQLGSPASELGQSCAPRLRPAAAFLAFCVSCM